MAATTPSPILSGLRTPPAPKFGSFADSWEPFQLRKSARIQQKQRANNRTPSPAPQLSDRHFDDADNDHHISGSPRTRKHRVDNTMASPTSPQKKRQPAADSVRRVSGSLTAESTSRAAAALGVFGNPERLEILPAGRSTLANGMPTPSKTPSKPPTEHSKANVKAVARNLFHEDGKSSTKKSHKYKIDSFSESDHSEEIQIYTDVSERIPEIDTSAENPFYGDQAAPEAPRRRRQRADVYIPGVGYVTNDEAVARTDGVLTMFRGKKTFRLFTAQEDVPGEAGEGGLASAVESRMHYPTRSAIKPRRLFTAATSSKKKVQIHVDEAEAETDIEEHVRIQPASDDDAEDEDEVETEVEDKEEEEEGTEQAETPGEKTTKTPGTPSAPRFAPASPPTTARTTRYGRKSAREPTPSADIKSKPSPFDGWRRAKSGRQAHGQKRPGGELAGEPSKRTKT